WPPHCVAGSAGACLAAALDLPKAACLVDKATLPEQDSYSAFGGTDLHTRLQARSVSRVFVGGLATEYCVLNTVRDAVRLGYRVVLLTDAIRAVNLNAGDGARAEAEMTGPLGCRAATVSDLSLQPTAPGLLLTDWYQLTMLKGYLDHAMTGAAVFEFFVRRLSPRRRFLVAAGLEQVLEFLESFRFSAPELEWLARSGLFDAAALRCLEDLRFTGDVDAMPEGTLVFENEPLLRVTAPLPEAQLAETRIINLLQYQTMIAAKAARMVLAAPGKSLVDFGLRRAHGTEAGLLAARASYLTGFAGTATVLADPVYGVPLYGTMAHSFIQAHACEADAFRNFAASCPEGTVLLIDTYDTEAATAKTIDLLHQLKKEGRSLRAVRLDSGDLAAQARQVRQRLDAAGFPQVRIFASGNLDEYALQALMESGAPIDGFGVGTRLTVSADAPYLDCAYKLHEYEERPCFKKSVGKVTLPGRKQVFRRLGPDGEMIEDVIGLAGETVEGTPLLHPVMRGGRRLSPPAPLLQIREYTAQQLSQLPVSLRHLDPGEAYPVRLSRGVRELAEELGLET
ncbi:MAG: nicotinate phosphoribosyltransferase, partial [Nitrospinaceae bacterium]